MLKYNIAQIFPTTIYVGDIENHEKYKEEFYKLYHKFDYEVTSENNTVSEECGNPLIHLEKSLEPLFSEITSHIKNYIHNVLNLRDLFDVTITKTWLSRAREIKDEIPWHIHSTSHISFTYYLNAPTNSHTITFSNQHEPNSLFLGMSKFNEEKEKRFVNLYNENNATTFFITPEEGKIVLFPSKLIHSTKSKSDEFDGERLAIVGDVSLILGEEYLSFPMGYINEKYWKKFK